MKYPMIALLFIIFTLQSQAVCTPHWTLVHKITQNMSNSNSTAQQIYYGVWKDCSKAEAYPSRLQSGKPLATLVLDQGGEFKASLYWKYCLGGKKFWVIIFGKPQAPLDTINGGDDDSDE